MSRYSVVIPAFNEEKTIVSVVNNVRRYVKDIIVVNDASTDGTKQVLDKVPVFVINNKSRKGYAKSLETGINEVFKNKFDYAITIDADGEHEAENLKKFISALNSRSPDFVIGKRKLKNRLVEHLVGNYTRLRFGVSDPFCGMKSFKRQVFQNYGYLEQRYTIGTEMLFKALKSGSTFMEVEISVSKRFGDSRFGNFPKADLMELKAFINIMAI